MNVLIAPDAFKDSLTAADVAAAIEKGVYSFSESTTCHHISVSDGGEGFLTAVASYQRVVRVITTETVDPLGRAIWADYLFDEGNRTAYVELAKASGIELLAENERNPMLTSTYGTGLQIRDALEKGAIKIFLGIGGSATNDGGTGIAHALGFRFYTSEDALIDPGGDQLHRIFRIEKPLTQFEHVEFFAVNDVLNPLFGKHGAAFTYAQQKGASPDEIVFLDKGLESLHSFVQKEFQIDESNTPGSGAAGGTAYGLKCFLGAEYLSGASFILGLSNFEALVSEEKIDLIITGEGKIDEQTRYGKFVFGIAQEAKKYDIPVIAICGKLELSASEINKTGLRDAVQIFDSTKPAAYSYENAAALISKKTAELLKKLQTGI